MALLKPMLEFFGRVFTPLIAIIVVVMEIVTWLVKSVTGTTKGVEDLATIYTNYQQTVGTAIFGWMPPAIQEIFALVCYMVPMQYGTSLVVTLGVMYVLATVIRSLKAIVPGWN